MKALNGSGGSTKGAGIIAAWNELRKLGYEPDVISGISVSAAIAVPFAIGKGNIVAEIMTQIDLDDFWHAAPVNERGNYTFSAIIRALRGKSLGDQTKMIDLIAGLVSEKEFVEYQDGEAAQVVVMSVDLNTGRKLFINLKKRSVSYDNFLKYTLASASIPGYAMPVCMEGMRLYDGGVRDHIISSFILKHYPVTECVSVYSRMEGVEEALDTQVDVSGAQRWEPKNYNIDALMRAIDILNYEVSFNDADREKQLAGEKKIKNLQIFMPKVLNSLYDTDNTRLTSLHDQTREMTKTMYLDWLDKR